jgi:hypothetical protein
MSVYVRIAAVMFLNFFIWGAWYVTAGLVLSKHGLGSEIGNVYSLAPIASLITPFLSCLPWSQRLSNVTMRSGC